MIKNQNGLVMSVLLNSSLDQFLIQSFFKIILQTIFFSAFSACLCDARTQTGVKKNYYYQKEFFFYIMPNNIF